MLRLQKMLSSNSTKIFGVVHCQHYLFYTENLNVCITWIKGVSNTRGPRVSDEKGIWDENSKKGNFSFSELLIFAFQSERNPSKSTFFLQRVNQ